MATIVTREGKGTPLNAAEFDANNVNLNNAIAATDAAAVTLAARVTVNESDITDVESDVAAAEADILTNAAAIALNTTHRGISTGNPHAVSSTDVGLGAVTNNAQLKRAAGDIDSFTEKGVPVAADLVLIEDSADTNTKKKVQLSNLPVNSHTVDSHSDTTATGAELETLTDGSNADTLHVHSSLPSHTIASHSDTTATGAELETLTNGANADSLHAHAVAAHTVASHSDTTATGLELNTLTDGSSANSLHKHTALYIDSSKTFEAIGTGAEIIDASGNNPALYWYEDDETTLRFKILASGTVDAYLQNTVHGGDIWFSAENTTGTARWVGLEANTPSFEPSPNETIKLGASGAAWLDVYTKNAVTVTSDRIKKRDIKAGPGLRFLNRLKPVSFKWTDGNRDHWGLLADEVKDALDAEGIDSGVYIDPAVKGENGPLDISSEGPVKGPQTLGLRITELIAPMIKGIQELNLKLDNLEGRLTTLESAKPIKERSA